MPTPKNSDTSTAASAPTEVREAPSSANTDLTRELTALREQSAKDAANAKRLEEELQTRQRDMAMLSSQFVQFKLDSKRQSDESEKAAIQIKELTAKLDKQSLDNKAMETDLRKKLETAKRENTDLLESVDETVRVLKRDAANARQQLHEDYQAQLKQKDVQHEQNLKAAIAALKIPDKKPSITIAVDTQDLMQSAAPIVVQPVENPKPNPKAAKNPRTSRLPIPEEKEVATKTATPEPQSTVTTMTVVTRPVHQPRHSMMTSPRAHNDELTRAPLPEAWQVGLAGMLAATGGVAFFAGLSSVMKPLNPADTLSVGRLNASAETKRGLMWALTLGGLAITGSAFTYLGAAAYRHHGQSINRHKTNATGARFFSTVPASSAPLQTANTTEVHHTKKSHP